MTCTIPGAELKAELTLDSSGTLNHLKSRAMYFKAGVLRLTGNNVSVSHKLEFPTPIECCFLHNS
jgi:hypothetical protein